MVRILQSRLLAAREPRSWWHAGQPSSVLRLCQEKPEAPPVRHPALQRATLSLSDYVVVPPIATLPPWAGPSSVDIMESNASFQILNKVLCKVKVRRHMEGE